MLNFFFHTLAYLWTKRTKIEFYLSFSLSCLQVSFFHWLPFCEARTFDVTKMGGVWDALSRESAKASTAIERVKSRLQRKIGGKYFSRFCDSDDVGGVVKTAAAIFE